MRHFFHQNQIKNLRIIALMGSLFLSRVQCLLPTGVRRYHLLEQKEKEEGKVMYLNF
jgi:hypothetical protein